MQPEHNKATNCHYKINFSVKYDRCTLARNYFYGGRMWFYCRGRSVFARWKFCRFSQICGSKINQKVTKNFKYQHIFNLLLRNKFTRVKLRVYSANWSVLVGGAGAVLAVALSAEFHGFAVQKMICKTKISNFATKDFSYVVRTVCPKASTNFQFQRLQSLV